MLSVMLVVLGICCYYVAPVSFLYENFRLFFQCLQLLLLCMIMGMTMISMLVQPYLETAIAYLMANVFCYKDKNLWPLLSKNLSSHRSRNMKTATMFAVCLAFLIFAGTTFKLIGDLIVYQSSSFFACDLFAMTVDIYGLPVFLYEAEISDFLNE